MLLSRPVYRHSFANRNPEKLILLNLNINNVIFNKIIELIGFRNHGAPKPVGLSAINAFNAFRQGD